MAAAPETQHQAASLQATGYTPVRTELSTPNMGSPGAGQLWAQVGRTAMEAGTMLMNSPLNPAVREELKARYKSAEEGINQFNTLDKAGIGPLMYTIQPGGGATAIAPGAIQDRTALVQVMKKLGLGITEPPPPAGGKEPPPAPGTDTTEKPKTSETTKEQAPPAEKKPPTLKEMGTPQASAVGLVPSQGGSTAVLTAGGDAGQPDTGQPQSPDIEAQPAAQYRAQYAAQQQPGSIWSPMGPSPMAPPAPAAQPQAPQDVAAAQAQREAKAQADTQALKAWQAQNAHPVASSSDAVTWGKGFDTRITDATYLPSGGPNGEPAYAFHLKGGAVNTVPISQMVKNGFGPSVAGQNTSSTLSTSEALSQQQPAPTPGMTLGVATGQAPPGMNLGQPRTGQPAPPAPGGVSDTTGAIASDQGGAQGQPGTSYDPTQYRQAVAQAAAQPGALAAEAGQQAGTRTDIAPASTSQPPPPPPNVSDSDQAEIRAKAEALGQTADYEHKGDQPIGTYAGYQFYRDDSPEGHGRAYSLLPSDPGQFYNPYRWYLGEPGYRQVELPESEQRRQMTYWVDRGDILGGPREVLKMNSAQMAPWLRRKWEEQNLTKSPSEGGHNLVLDKALDLRNTVKRMRDEYETLGSNGLENLNSDHAIQAEGRQLAEKFPGLKDLVPRYNETAMNYPSAKLVLQLKQDRDHLNDLLKDQAFAPIRPGQSELGTPSFDIAGQKIPALGVVSDALDTFTGRHYREGLRNLDNYLKRVDGRYGQLVSGAQTQGERIDARHKENIEALKARGDLPDDPDNPNEYKQHVMKITTADYPDWSKKVPPETKFLYIKDDGSEQWSKTPPKSP